MKGFAGRLPVVASLMVIAFMAVWTTANRSDSSNVSSGLAGYFATGGSYVIGDLEDSVGNHVTWWGAQWSADNPMSGGSAPGSFKGFENSNANPTCGSTYTTDPGNSSRPPAAVSPTMEIIVSSNVTKHGSTISGNVAHIVVVQTNAGYEGNPGHEGTGTVIQQIC